MRPGTVFVLTLLAVSSASAQRTEGDFIARDFRCCAGMGRALPGIRGRARPGGVCADSAIRAYLDRQSRALDANDVIYAFDASRDYDPSSRLESITVPVLAINSADDFVNPPELGLMEALMTRVRQGRYVLIPISERTRGHGTHSQPAVWKDYLAEFIQSLPPAPAP